MKKFLLSALVAASCLQLAAQDNTASTSGKKMYTASASELIFSWGDVEAPPLDPNPLVRFTCFLHLGQQLHIDFNDHVGFYTGLAIRNVGIINDLNDTVKIKQRVYTLGLPLALKLGNMNGTNIAAGVEGELALNYKQKVFVNDEKSKMNEWFSDRAEIFLPSAFAELKFKSGAYLKFKYYLTDFLKEGAQKTNVPNLDYRPTKSQMMYVSFGFAIKNRDLTKTLPGTSPKKI